ncbi:efflux RND transporter periplasmic adaptor subunit [Bradyrhizobium sp.]|uniref:efflux RND transporter periplasmic adaptor subunit n=1 Tax=Bradyrhizobium sp. TaxID=376 RepID=UPI0040376BA8
MPDLRAQSACIALMLAALAPLLAGCKEPTANAAAAIPEVDVSVVVVQPRARAVIRELPGRIAPTRVAEVRPRVSGIIVERLFHQGSEVKAGEPLYRIDPRPFEVEVQSALAALARAKAVFEQATSHANRIGTLYREKAAPEAKNEEAIAALRQAEADVAARTADVARARLNLDYATIRAPIDGIVGAAHISEGALVVQNDATSLATIQQLDPVYADFTQSASEMNQLRRALDTGELVAPPAIKVRLELDNGELYSVQGKLLFSEAKVDAQTGKVTMRAEFANPLRQLLPGMYVRVQLEQGIDADAIAVPEQSIQRNSGGGSEVFLVGDDGKVTIRPVKTGAMQGGIWFVTDGLKAGDKVVVEGFQKFTPGDKVRTLSWAEADASAGLMQTTHR